MKGFDDAEFRDDDGCFVVHTNELTDKVTHPQNGIRIEFPISRLELRPRRPLFALQRAQPRSFGLVKIRQMGK